MRLFTKLLVAAVAICTFTASAKEVTITKELQAAIQDIAVHAKVVLVDGSGATPSTFHEDSDPMTLQIVMLAKPSDGASQVSSDGEVIFLQKDASEKEQQALFATAFYLKAKARLAASQPAKTHSSP